MNIDSTNMNPELMMNIAKTIKEYKDDYDGFVVAHGTDTMSYTAAALVYMLNNFYKPVVITGSQLPMEAEYTDAKKNLSDAVIYACEGLVIRRISYYQDKPVSIDHVRIIGSQYEAEISGKGRSK